MTACQHARGEHSDDYRHCLDCGQEWMLLGDVWVEIVGWVRVQQSLIDEIDARKAGEP